MTKIIADASPREAVASWLTALGQQHQTLIFRSASAFLPSSEPLIVKGKGKERVDDALGLGAVRSLVGKWAKEKSGSEPLTVAVVGSTNVCKFQCINLPK